MRYSDGKLEHEKIAFKTIVKCPHTHVRMAQNFFLNLTIPSADKDAE